MIRCTKIFMCLFVIFLLHENALAQLAPFNLQVNSTPESCTQNATLNFVTTNTTAGATIVFTVFLLPDTTNPVATTTQTSVPGLTAGNYSVTATQSLGTFSNSQQQNVTIQNTITPLTFSLQGLAATCGNNGSITVSSNTGVMHEIISGPVTVPLQASSTFSGLPAGVYVVRVFDACGEGVVQTHTLEKLPASLNIEVMDTTQATCELVNINLVFNAVGQTAISYPLNVNIVVYPPSGEPIIYNQVILGPTFPDVFVSFQQAIPIYENSIYSYSIDITDSCGNSYSDTYEVNDASSSPGYSVSAANCINAVLTINGITAVTMTSAPDQYPNSLPFDYTGFITQNQVTIGGLPLGDYIFMVTDLCGNVTELPVQLTPPTAGPPSFFISPGCDIGMGGFFIAAPLQSVIITSAPAGFGQPLPYNAAELLLPIGFVYSDLPSGNYQVSVVDACGNPFNLSIDVQGYYSSIDLTVYENCGSFNLEFSSSSNNSDNFYLQYFNPATNTWGHPSTLVAYVPGTVPNGTNGIEIVPNQLFINLAFNGTFRIVKRFQTFVTGSTTTVQCFEVLEEFFIRSGPEISGVFSFMCSDGTYNALVEAQGIPPLTYRITLMDGAPVSIQNGASPLFANLSPALYNFQVEDGCGNIVNRQFAVPSPLVFEITAQSLCSGQQATLSVPQFDFLNYQWTHQSNPSVVLSSSSSLSFAPFDPAQHFGTYSVTITYPADPLSCLNAQLSFEIPSSSLPSEAGTGMQVQYCDRPEIDLFTLLTPPYDLGGVWTESTSSGGLTGNIFTTTGLASGTFLFTYTVTGGCGSDQATVEVTLFEPLPAPLISAPDQICAGGTIDLSAAGPSDLQYVWSGPGGFSATGQTVQITSAVPGISGMYIVTASNGDCASPSTSVEVDVREEVLATITGSCVNNQFTLTALASPQQGVLSYTWSGPNGYSAIGNPVTVEGNHPGMYTVTINSDTVCGTTQELMVTSTQCIIPLGISPNGDGNNDWFDLGGFDVNHIKIFNRYGMTVYERARYRNEWNGKDSKDRDLPAGTYYYLLELASGESKTGWVYILRQEN